MFCCFALLIARPNSSRTAGQEFKHRLLTTDLNVIDYWPCFSPDSKTVLFSRRADKGRTWDLFVIPASGGQARRLSATRLPVSANRPNWSIKNNLIAFTGQSSDGGASVWLINADGSKPPKAEAKRLPQAGLAASRRRYRSSARRTRIRSAYRSSS